MKQHLTATFMFDPLNVADFTKVSDKINRLKESGYHEKVRTMNKEGQVIVKLEIEEEL
ncbi:hypothetical protein Blue_064 [Bacillus phage Deep Blue]|uniref:Uncharacterized protein n=1 Tax=Bacillus phage Deep Blue TaxID=1792245 RepID=A0A140HLM5_9CAUD|nr:hypothetical protein Blue_064 [Bacillus phage Deep Blue]AMO25887.1 hypothetical protein Blue_064 [Bacillus phage Deep Blue]